MSQYKLKWMIGKGGMGTVHEARRILPNGQEIPVACKELNTDRQESEIAIEMFYRESEINLRLSHNHPGLVTVHDCIKTQDGSLYLVMELVEGCSVGELIDTYGQLSADITRYVSGAVLDALGYIHACDVLHRDVSPCNILISTAGDVKLSDLGLAKLLENGQAQTNRFRGKAAYASPEQIRCLPMDARSDLYSVGAVIYEMITGIPLAGMKRTEHQAAVQIAEPAPMPLIRGISRDLRKLTCALLQMHPRDRPASASQAKRQLRRNKDVLGVKAALAELVTPIHQKRSEERRRAYDGRDRIISNASIIVVNDTEPEASRTTQHRPEASRTTEGTPEASQPAQRDLEIARATQDALPPPQRASLRGLTRRRRWAGMGIAAIAASALVYYGLRPGEIPVDDSPESLPQQSAQPAQSERTTDSPQVIGPGQLDTQQTVEHRASDLDPKAPALAHKEPPRHRHRSAEPPPAPQAAINAVKYVEPE